MKLLKQPLGALENSVVSLEMLQETPSMKEGYPSKFERDIRLLVCNWIEQATVLLKLPQLAAATAQVLVHRYYFMESIDSAPLIVTHLVLKT